MARCAGQCLWAKGVLQSTAACNQAADGGKQTRFGQWRSRRKSNWVFQSVPGCFSGAFILQCISVYYPAHWRKTVSSRLIRIHRYHAKNVGQDEGLVLSVRLTGLIADNQHEK